MALYLRTPTRVPLSDGVTVLGPGADPRIEAPSRIALRLGDGRHDGRADDEVRGITVLVSGYLASVPEPLRGGSAAKAAQALAALYAKYGVDAFAKVDGAFCFAILDWRRSAIILGRDKLGIARAYLSRDDGVIVFADCLADLLYGRSRPELDIDSVYAFLMIGWVPTPHSMFRGVEKLPPGTFLELRDGALTEVTYFDVPNTATAVRHRSSADLQRGVTEHLDRAVDRGWHLGGRWGSFLSGGVDSSSVVSSLARVSGGSFPTYFGGFSPELNRYLPNPERPALSQLVATRFHTNHHMLSLGPEAVETMPEIVGALEEPVCDGGCIVLDAVMKAAREETDGLMTGIGGDFLFTGERRHMVLKLLRCMRVAPDPLWQAANWILERWVRRKGARSVQFCFDLKRLLAIRGLAVHSMYANFFSQADLPDLRALFMPDTHAAVSRSPLREIDAYFEGTSEIDPLSRFLYLDLKTHTPDHCVREAETLGRQAGITTYHPFLDAEFVNFAMSVPAADKLSGFTLKVPLKRAMRGRVPDQVLDRRKGGLGSPIRWWVTQPDGFAASVLSRRNLERRGLFSADSIDRFRSETAEGASDHTKLLWSLFTLELWMQRFIDP